MTISAELRRIVLAALGCAMTMAAPARLAWSAGDPDAETARRQVPIRQGSAMDVEELDLGDRRETAIDAPENAPPPGAAEKGPCDALLPSGAPVGAWRSSLSDADACQAKLWAASQAPIAYAAHDLLWCSDPGGRKLEARQKALARAAQNRALAVRRDAWEISEKFRRQGFAPGVSASNPTLGPSPPPAPYYDPGQEKALHWDAREADKCRSWTVLGPELGPALSARALGRVDTASGSCDAMLVEANLLSGRRGFSRLSWATARCPGFSPPTPSEIALALSAGPSEAQSWQDRHFQSWRWQGPPPRPARSRSAEGF